MRAARTSALIYLVFVLTAALASVTGCSRAPAEKLVTVVADDTRWTVSLASGTVREVLELVDVTVRPQDRVVPDLWEEVRDGQTIRVIRVETREEVERRTVPFQHQTIKSEALPAGERKLLQLGEAGEEEIVFRVTLEDGVHVSREEVLRRVVKPPIDEIIAVGVEEDLPAVPISGTAAYISAGNAWVMRGSSAGRRPLTSSGDLDGRVLALSPDGEWLIYSRVEPGLPEDMLNSLWIVGTSVLNEDPKPLSIRSALYAEWLRDGRGILYSTGERVGGAPGWRAHNDIWRARIYGLTAAGKRTGKEVITVLTERLIEPPAETTYSWWGTNYALSPENRFLAFGRADEVGLYDVASGQETILMKFAAFHTYGEWVWLPELSWSPDGNFLVFSAHGPDPQGGEPEDSPLFDLWVVERSGEIKVRLVPEVGMWAAPRWSPARTNAAGERVGLIAFGRARVPRHSQDSRYDLYVMDRDGSDRQRLFPPQEMPGLVAPDLAWSPDGREMIIAHEGILYLVSVESGKWVPLTADGHSGQPRWAGGPAVSQEKDRDELPTGIPENPDH